MTGRREGAIALLVGVLAVAALAGAYGDPAPSATGDGVGEGAGESMQADAESDPGAPPLTVSASSLRAAVVATAGVGTVFTVLAALAVVWLRGVDGLKRIARLVGELLAGTGLYLLLVLVVVGLIFGFAGETSDLLPRSPAESASDPTGGGGADAAETDATTQPWLLGLALLGAVATAVVALVRYLGDEEDDETTAETESAEAPDDGGRLAGSRIDPQEPVSDVAPSNGVFSAWRRLADAVDEATDRTLTSGQVATAAVERGLDREAVETLTREFEAVRYGHREVTPERERRAERALAGLPLDGGEET